MIRIRKYITAIIIVCLAISFAKPATADCKQPELASFLEDSRAVLNYQGAYFPGPQALWLPFDWWPHFSVAWHRLARPKKWRVVCFRL
jgi:hypothetical protein